MPETGGVSVGPGVSGVLWAGGRELLVVSTGSSGSKMPEYFTEKTATTSMTNIKANFEKSAQNPFRVFCEVCFTATVVKIDPQNGNVVVDTGTSEAVLLKGEQIPGEEFEVGEHIKVFVMEVKNEIKGPIVTLSRTHFGLVKRLFELEVPEIQDGTVVIKGIAREAGSRTKMAVESRDENVDPVGACIGNRGGRISSILNELHGEKIDIVKYSEQPEEYVLAALSPASVKSVTMDGERSCRVIVAPDQLSLAIGKEGQNARLAARLTGYKIDIKTV